LRIALFTPVIKELFNLRSADFGRPLSDITHKLDYPNLMADAETVLDSLKTIEREMITNEGRVFIMTISPYRTAEDYINGIVITFVDITSRKHAEGALRASEEKYRRLFTEIDEAFQILEAVKENGKVVDIKFQEVNPAFQKMFSPANGTAVNRSINELMGDAANTLMQSCKQVLESQQSLRTELKMGDRWFDVCLFPQGNDRIGGLCQETTEKRLFENELFESRERLRITMESAIDFAIITFDAEGMIRGWNSGARIIFGYNEEEVTGQHGRILFTEKDQKAQVPETEMLQAREDGRAMDERWHQRKDGTKFFMSGVMATIRSSELTGYVKVARDITDRKLREEQKDEFIGIASHELKTPVTSIKAYVQMLQETFREEGDAENFEFVKKLDSQVDRLTELIKTLLDFTKVSEGQILISPEEFDLNALVKEVAGEMTVISKKNQLIVKAGKIKPVSADRERINQVVVNLISNAIKYSPADSKIFITTEDMGDNVKVSVKDEGIGIPQDLQHRIFDRFFRANNPQMHTYPGMGLGLYISAGVIRRHGGTIKVESEEGKGSLFYFTLPYTGIV
jgi:PAS domain S-box-containing protein